MKRIICLALILLLTAGLAACGPKQDGEESAKPDNEKVELTLWTYPVGSWGNSTSVSNLVADFTRKYPDYEVNVECLDYDTGDKRIAEAAEKDGLPDLVMEGPERLVANWGEQGLMVDLSDLWESEKADEIYQSVRSACRHRNGAFYEYPICMSAHCMAINRDMFKAAGALQYLDEETRTWTTDGFISAVKALKNNGQEKVAMVYCGGQAGDQGTRALVNNLYGGSFADAQHTKYVANSPENAKALDLLKSTDGIVFDPQCQGNDEIAMFCRGELAMAFCWNVSQEITQTVNDPDLGFDIMPMAFPTDGKEPTLQGGIWGLGIFDNGDEAKIEAAKEFIRFMTEEDTEYAKAVLNSTYWPVREMADIYANDDLMQEYGMFTKYMGDYYQVTPGWADVRTAWWNMLQDIEKGEDAQSALTTFNKTANSAAEAAIKN